jgi:hypothetical protein
MRRTVERIVAFVESEEFLEVARVHGPPAGIGCRIGMALPS